MPRKLEYIEEALEEAEAAAAWYAERSVAAATAFSEDGTRRYLRRTAQWLVILAADDVNLKR